MYKLRLQVGYYSNIYNCEINIQLKLSCELDIPLRQQRNVEQDTPSRCQRIPSMKTMETRGRKLRRKAKESAERDRK